MSRFFECQNYRELIRFCAENKARRKQAPYARLAKHLGVQRSFLSQVVHSKRQLQLETALTIAEYFQLTPIETEFFLLLVQMEKAKSTALKNFFLRSIANIRKTPLPGACIVAGHKWEFTHVNTIDKIDLLVEVDLTEPGLMKGRATAMFQQEVIETTTQERVHLVGNQIINPYFSRSQKFFTDGIHWCSAEIPVRTMTYEVIDATHLAVRGDPLHPEGIIWVRKT